MTMNEMIAISAPIPFRLMPPGTKSDEIRNCSQRSERSVSIVAKK